MTSLADKSIRYKRSRFSTRLPTDRLYTGAHYWIQETEPGLWRVGFTKFATRMLGDLVECDFQIQPGEAVEVGQTIATVEGFKALTEVYCVVSGQFAGGNPELDQNVTLMDSDPYGNGWLYAVRGEPEPNSVDVHLYIAILDTTIDKMLEQQQASKIED